MKNHRKLSSSLCSLFLTLFGITSAVADPKIEAFAQKYAEARTKGDVATLQAMTFSEGASPDDLKKLKEDTETSLKYRSSGKITSVTVEPLPANAEERFSPQIYNGEKIEPNLKPEGMIKLSDDSGGAHMAAYGVKGGTPWLVGIKVTKLNWSGPPEDRFYFSVNNKGGKAVKIKVECSFRASGVELSRTKDNLIKAHESSAIAVNANELISAKVTTDEPDVTLQASIYRFNEAERKKTNLIDQEISKAKPLIYTSATPTQKIEKSEHAAPSDGDQPSK